MTRSEEMLDLSIVMISLNEAHHLRAALEDICGWCRKVYLVDSLSSDSTIDIALEYGVEVVQRPFRNFGDQWNFALSHFEFDTNWIMKLDPDERLTGELKAEISRAISQANSGVAGFRFPRLLSFMGRPLPTAQSIERIWRTGKARFSDVRVNEHLIIDGHVETLQHYMHHLDSPNLHHWYAKQNKYFTAEAIMQFEGESLATTGRIFGTALERRMWLKKAFWKVPFRYFILHMYHLFGTGAWRAGREGRIWAKMRTEAYRSQEFKVFEMRKMGVALHPIAEGKGDPDRRVPYVGNNG